MIPQELLDILISNPETLSGAVRFKGTRVPVQALIDTLNSGQGIDDFLEGWPNVPREYAERLFYWIQDHPRDLVL